MARPKPKDHYILEIDRVSQTGNLIANCAHSHAKIDSERFDFSPGNLVKVEIIHVGGTVKVDVLEPISPHEVDEHPPVRVFDGANIRTKRRLEQQDPEDRDRIERKVEKNLSIADSKVKDKKYHIKQLGDIAPGTAVGDSQQTDKNDRYDTSEDSNDDNMNYLLNGKQ